jgi:hypothetical protein
MASRNGGRQRCVRVVITQILLTGKETDERSAFLGVVIADGAAEGGVFGFQGVEHRPLRDGRGDVEGHFASDFGEGAEVERQMNSDGHINPVRSLKFEVRSSY